MVKGIEAGWGQGVLLRDSFHDRDLMQMIYWWWGGREQKGCSECGKERERWRQADRQGEILGDME